MMEVIVAKSGLGIAGRTETGSVSMHAVDGSDS